MLFSVHPPVAWFPCCHTPSRRAMLKIQGEDKAMVEQLRYDQLAAESNVRADLPQIMFRKLRQQVGFHMLRRTRLPRLRRRQATGYECLCMCVERGLQRIQYCVPVCLAAVRSATRAYCVPCSTWI